MREGVKGHRGVEIKAEVERQFGGNRLTRDGIRDEKVMLNKPTNVTCVGGGQA